MKNCLFAILFLILTAYCVRKLPTPVKSIPPSLGKITSLKADNLSEDLTANDEIHLMIWLVKDSIPNRFVLKEWQDTMSFHKTDISSAKTLSIQYSVTSIDPSKTYIVLLLMEEDTERSLEERATLVRKSMQRFNYQYSDKLKAEITNNILDDDLVGLSFHKLSDLQKNPTGEIIFSGIHLFDRYFYRLRYSWQ